jgi:hypothetical protein
MQNGITVYIEKGLMCTELAGNMYMEHKQALWKRQRLIKHTPLEQRK